MTDRRFGGAVLALATVVLALAWVQGPGGPPLYDGLPIGTPHYRYLDPPAGSARTPPPGSVNYVTRLSDVPFGAEADTMEQPIAQADASIPVEFLDLPSGTTSVRVGLNAVQPPAPAPADGAIDGNVYRLSVTTLSGQPLRMKPGAARLFQVQLLGTGSSREPYVEQYTGTGWVRLPFTHPDNGIFQFNPSQPGEFALVVPPGRPLLGPGLKAAVVIGAALLVLAAMLAGVRRHRLQWADWDYDGPEGEGSEEEAGVPG